MAKLNFKDLIFKFLQKDEDHDCEKVHPKMSHKEWMNTEPVKTVKENIEVYITKKGSGPVNKRSIVKDFNNKAEAEKWIKWYKTGNMKDVESIKLFDLAKAMKYMDNRPIDEATRPDPTQYGPDKVAKAMKIAVNSDGKYTIAVREIEKIAKNLSKVSTIARALQTANEQTISERGGANTSSRQGSVSRGAKKKYRFGYRVAEKQPTGDKLAEEAKDIAVGQRISFDQLSQSLKDLWTEAADKEKGASTAKVPPVAKDNKPGVKIAKIRLKRDKMDGPEGDGKDEGAELAKKEDEVALLKQKMETEKAKSVEKATKKLVNPETGEPLLQIGIAYKHIRDKLDKEKEKKKEEVKESSEYLKSKLSSTQIANIKATWAKKKASDVTIGVKDMIKKMDIPTQLAIKAADIPHISKLVEDKEEVNEGYEGTILAYLKKYADKAYFSYRKLMVKKGSEGVVKTVLTRGVNDRSSLIYSYDLPPIVGVNEGVDADYLASKMNDKQIANIKNVWKNKKATDVTDAVRQMIKRMDIPTQLAIKHADIPHISKLVEIATHGHGPRLTFERLWLKHKRGDKAGN